MIILQKPRVSEKSMKLAEQNLYTFLVGKNTTKEQIARYIADKFKVKVTSVKTVTVKGRKKMQRTKRKSYFLPDIKKALVQVKKGQKIALFETPKDGSTDSTGSPQAGSPQGEVTVTTAENEPKLMKNKTGFLNRGTKVRVEKGATGAAPTTQRKVITGK